MGRRRQSRRVSHMANRSVPVRAGDELAVMLAGHFAGDRRGSEHAGMYTAQGVKWAGGGRPFSTSSGVSTTMTRDVIATDKLAAPVGPFSLGVRGAGLLFLSGQVAQDPATGKLIDGDVARQMHQILSNMSTTLEAAGKSLADVVRVGVYLTDLSNYALMNEAYGEHFAAPYPARTTIGVASLPLGAAVEMDMVVG